jgi:hypothetical protein
MASITLLVVPVFVFLSTKQSAIRMAGTTLVCAFVFVTAISFFTNPKRQEVFSAIAAYCAVLVVFIGNPQQVQTSHV